MSSSSVGTPGSSPLTLSGLATGLNTSQIISALMSAARQPVTRMTTQSEELTAQQQELQSIQSSLRALALAASEFSLPSLFQTSQTATSSEPTRVAAAATSGAGVGGHEVEVTKLASSAQRTFTFTSPAAEDTITIDGHEYKLAAGASAAELASKVNSDSKGTVYAAALEGGKVVLSTRATGATGPEYIKVTDPGGTLAEVAGSGREGTNAEYSVDGVAGTATTNTVTTAIPGVTLTLLGVTTKSGPVTVVVQPPGPSTSAIENQVKAFVSTYNQTIEAIQRQLTTKPPANPQNAKEFAVGTLFGDQELSQLVSSMREAMYEPIAGLPAEMSSPADIGVSTGAATGGSASSQSSLEGLLKLEPARLTSAVQANPEGVEKMLQQWSVALQKTVEGVAAPGGTMEARVTGDSTQVSELKSRIASMNEILAVRERTLQETFAQLEGIVNQNNSQVNWLISQSESLTKSGL